MSYSAFFTAGLTLASRPRSDSIEDRPSAHQSHGQTTTTPSKPRIRRRRSSLTIAASPMSAVKSPIRSANEAARSSMRTPSQSPMSIMEVFQASQDPSQTSTRPKMARRKTVSGVQDMLHPLSRPAPCPAPTAPLPPLPPIRANRSRQNSSASFATAQEDAATSNGPTLAPPGSRRANVTKKSSSAVPPFQDARSAFTSSV